MISSFFIPNTIPNNRQNCPSLIFPLSHGSFAAVNIIFFALPALNKLIPEVEKAADDARATIKRVHAEVPKVNAMQKAVDLKEGNKAKYHAVEIPQAKLKVAINE